MLAEDQARMRGKISSRPCGARATPTMYARCALFCIALMANDAALAGRVMDYIRSYDLNDYSLGLSMATSQSPYAGVGSSGYAYPYLTSFTHSALTKDWLLIRDENLGVRFVTDKDWEFGLVGRVQTLGLGAGASEQLRGLDERSWAIEAGPLLGWRRWPVHLQFRSYLELPNLHSGTTSELEASLPVDFERGFFVPSLRLRRMSSDYAEYYFGVSPGEATPTRPEYSPGSSLDWRAGFSLGYELTPQWLLKASASVTWYDDVVVNSPIVDKNHTWSATIGAAYNADLFQPRDYEGTASRQSLKIRTAAFSSTIATDARYDDANAGTPGDDVDFEEFLGVSDREAVFQVDLYYRLAYFHRLDLSYFRIDRDTGTTLVRDFVFGDATFAEGTEVAAGLATQRLRLAYSYSLMRDNQKELGVSLGLSFGRFELELAAPETGQRERALLDAPLPTMGVFGSIALGENWELDADLALFALEFDRYQGYSAQAIVNFERRFGEHLAAGIGYNFYATRLEGSDDDFQGLLRTRNYGPKIFFSWYY